MMIPLSLHAGYQTVGKVTKTRGKVTILAPGELQSRKLKSGDQVREDSSILTGKSSFARLSLNDGSSLNIGPNSKMVVVHLDKSGNGVVSLLKGKMRSIIKKRVNKNKKFFIQTRTAAMAVRGTEFEAIYNPENKVSALLTYEGSVAIEKTNELVLNLKSKKREIKRRGKKLVLNREENRSLEGLEKLKEIFKKKTSVIVKKGQFSSTIKKYDNVSEAVRISPIQLNTLYQNDEYVEKKVTDIRPRNLESSKIKLFLIPQEQTAPVGGIDDQQTRKYAARAGGLLDLNSGHYIAPTKSAKFEKRYGVYTPDNIGLIDKRTGQYAPPVGLKLSAFYGFFV